jgi:lipid kinase YegS
MQNSAGGDRATHGRKAEIGLKRTLAVVVRPPAEEARLEELRAAVVSLRRDGHRVSVRVTFEAGDARRFARRAARAGWDVVVSAGGDGTLNEVVNGLSCLRRPAPLAVVPLGTANDFAMSLGIPDDAGAALRLAAEGTAQPIDIARVNRRSFINVSTGGFGADISQSVGRGMKRRAGGLAYVLRGVRGLVRFDARRGVFRADGDVIHAGEFTFFAVGNARQTGGGTPLTPLAQLGDGRLDIMLVHGVTRLQFIRLLPRLRAGTHLKSPHVSYFRADELRVETDGEVSVNADGELVAGESFDYDVLPRPQPVIMP